MPSVPEATPAAAGPQSRPFKGAPPRVPLRTAGLHLGSLSALAVAEPLFDLLSKNPDFLAARGMTGWDVVALALVLVLVPPVALLALEALAGLVSRTLQSSLHLLFVAALVALIAVQALKKVGLGQTGVAIAGAVLIGLGAALAYARLAGLRSFLSALSPAPVFFLALFLFFSPVNDLTFASGSAATANVSSRIPVVMVVFDEVSTAAFQDARGRVDPVLYPNLASLARDGTWFRNATAPTDTTTSATPAILTGSLPKRHATPILSKYPHNLFTLLGRRYRMKVSQEATDMCPTGLCQDTSGESATARERALASDLGLVYLHVIAPKPLERDLPSVSDTLGNFGGDTDDKTVERSSVSTGHTGRQEVLHELGGGRAARFESFVDAVDRSARPTLYFKHSLLPHVPFQYLPSGRRYHTDPHEAIPGLVDEPSWSNDYLLAESYQRHLLQAGFADHLLGTLLRRLRQKHVYDRALVVVTADNGESFLHHANRHEASAENVEDIASTPLFIKRPYEHSGRIVDRHVRTEDILPSIADVLGIRIPWRVTGRSVFDLPSRIPQDVTFYLRSGRKLVLSLPDYERRIHAALERKVALFGSDGRGPGLYGLGPHRELIGRPLGELSVARAPVRAKLDGAGAFSSVDLRSDFIPAQLTGRIVGGGAPHVRDLAVALNGRIVAVGQTFSLEGSRTENFSIILPERRFHAGRNPVELLSVSGQGAGLRLESLGRAG